MNLGNRSRSVRRITTLIGVATLITGFGAAVATSPVHASVSDRQYSNNGQQRVSARQRRQARRADHL